MLAADHAGLRYGKLTGIKRVENSGRRTQWLWRCDCGNETVASPDHVKSGHTASCGCLWAEACRKHGHGHDANGKQTRTYRAWANMKSRVAGDTEDHKRAYTERGIVVCARWSESFENFLADMGECPPGLTLDRENNDGIYEPSNCRWATPMQQTVNRRVTHFVVYRGETLCLAEACRKAGVLYDTAMKRMTRGLSAQQALDQR